MSRLKGGEGERESGRKGDKEASSPFRPFPLSPALSFFLSLALLLVFCLVVFGPRAAWAQAQRPAAPQYDVVALRVEFQPDTTRFTTGDGTFDGELFPDSLQPSIDPLPHDAAYFEAHLAFLEDYVARVSDGQTQVTTHLVPEVVRLSQEMGAYSPTGFEADSDAERVKLVNLIVEAWTTASQVSTFDLSGFDPERTAFVLFHAGVGRDIELLGTVLDKTPLDLPSIFFSPGELSRLGGGGLTFNGMPVRQTVLLPRTESRPGFNFVDDSSFLLELSINGLLAASFFNYLGVPDLFNAETGASAIGPFGLMDPLGIFAYSGLFAPEPTAWTKYFLGWVTPIELMGDGPETVTLQAAGLDGSSDVARVPISSAEYYLVENRNRDPEGDGLVLRVWQRGEIVEQRVPVINDDFNRFSVDGFVGGVVVGVDNYDFALPGIDADDVQYEGGILIWHIDERILADKIATGGVNADPDRRAVDLEEADSAQDLGEDNALGAPFDFFFADNQVGVEISPGTIIQFYENRFGPETIPNSNSNEDGPSFIVLEDFSGPGTEMTFAYRREAASGIRPLELNLNVSGSYTTPEGSFLNGFGSEEVEGVVYRTNFGVVVTSVMGVGGLVQGGFVLTPLVTPDERIAQIDVRGGPGLQVFDGPFPKTRFTFAVPDGAVIKAPTSLTFYDDVNDYFYAFFAGGTNKALLQFEKDGVNDDDLPGFVSLDAVDEPLSVAFDASAGQIMVAGRSGAQALGGSESWSYTLGASDSVGQVVFGRDRSGLVGVLPVLTRSELLFLRADGSVETISVSRYGGAVDTEGGLSMYPVLADLDDDGLLDALTTQGRSLVAFSQNGALLAGFPIDLSAESVTQPLVAELTDSGAWSILVSLTDGYLYAYDLGQGGRQAAGFPLAVGETMQATPLLQGSRLFAIAGGGRLHAWELDNLGAIWWGQLYGNRMNQSFVALPDGPAPQPTPQAAGLIVEAETYNWPNPIRDGQTFLRCMTTEDAAVRITIINAAGSLIDDVTLDLTGGTPAEHLWQTRAASGLYYARITATSRTGQTATQLIKMAIIR